MPDHRVKFSADHLFMRCLRQKAQRENRSLSYIARRAVEAGLGPIEAIPGDAAVETIAGNATRNDILQSKYTACHRCSAQQNSRHIGANELAIFDSENPRITCPAELQLGRATFLQGSVTGG
jgi:hypothetical protein